MRHVFLIFVITFLLSGCMAKEQYHVLFKSSNRLVEPYGICTHINRVGPEWEFDSREKDLSLIQSVGATFIRTDFDWGYCQSDKEKTVSFSHHDQMMRPVDSLSLQMLGILSSPKPGNFEGWVNYVTKTTSHYKKRVRYWEVINEADLWHRRQPDYRASDYVRELKTASPIIKKGNKYAKVLFSGISNVNLGFIEKVFDENVSECFDIMNIHWYANKKNEPETFFEYFMKLHSIMQEYDINKPVWLTETGCTTSEDYADEETQARRLPRLFLISFACGVEKVFWYKSRSRELSEGPEDNYGLWHKDYTPKPAYYAYKTLTQMCPSKSTRPQIQRKGNVYIATWKQPNGKKVSAIWTSKGIEKIGVANVPQKIFDYLGNEVEVFDSTIVVSPIVQYCFGNFTVK